MSSIPVILVCAKSEAAADDIISEVLRGEQWERGAGGARVWAARTRYYRARLALLGCADGAPAPARAAGLLLHLAADECAAWAAAAEPRAARAPHAAVRVLAADCAELDGAALAWAARRRLAPVALRAEGAAAVREALLAHPWAGERERAAPPEPAPDAWAAALGSLAPAAAAARSLPHAERLAAAESVLAAFCAAIGEDVDDL